MFSKDDVINLNNLLKKIKDNRDEFIEVIEKICPNPDCDPQLESNKEAIKCEYFTVCNILGSYSLMPKEDQEKADEFLELFYKRLNRKIENDSTMYS